MALTLTDTAAERVRSFIAKRGKGVGLRLGVRTSGCSGFAYTVDYADEIHVGDHVFDTPQGLKLIVGAKSLPFLDGMEVDFVREGLNEGFKFRNPNVKNTCGCGESFGV